MFGGAFFGKTYFGGTYFGPNVEVTIVIKKKRTEESVSGAEDEYTVKTKVIRKDEYEPNKMKIFTQILQEDEEIVAIIVAAIKAGIV